jgi:hypothetical protein
MPAERAGSVLRSSSGVSASTPAELPWRYAMKLTYAAGKHYGVQLRAASQTIWSFLWSLSSTTVVSWLLLRFQPFTLLLCPWARSAEIRSSWELTLGLSFGTLPNSCTLGHLTDLASLGRTMLVDTVTQMLPFLALGALVVATLVAALAALRSSRRAERIGEDRLELLRDQHERLELLRDERRMLTEELELERQERL